MKNSKKLVALLAVGTMMLASTVGVSASTVSTKTLEAMTATKTIDAADGSGVYSATLNVDVQTSTPVINVSVPTTSGLILNPYGLDCSMAGKGTTSQVISPVQTIQNNSNVPIKVGVTVNASVDASSEMKLQSGTATKATNKAACLLFNAVAFDTTQDNKIVFENGVTPLKAGTTIGTAPTLVSGTAGNFASTVLSTATVGVKPSVLTVKQGGGYYYFGISGDCSMASTQTWEETDTATISYAFTFTPSIIETSTP